MPSPAAFVLDGSLALAWCFPDEHAPYPRSVLDSLASVAAAVPAIWHNEVANALLIGERRGRCSAADTDTWTAFSGGLPIAVDPETQARAWPNTRALARTHQLTHYDASYLELAIRLALPLATLDNRLGQAAGVPAYTPPPPAP